MPLVLVPTPLGNLRDITLRALDTLRDANLIVAEDTRVAQRLLAALDLPRKSIWSYREQNAARVTGSILERAQTELVVVVTDAGLPGISDPGRDLVASARELGVPIEVLPGPTAFACVAVLSGFVLDGFSFEGFVPRQASKRERAFRAALERGRTTVWYDTPSRAHASLVALNELDSGVRIFLVREFTKKFEQQVLGTALEVAAAIGEEPRGEIAFAIDVRSSRSDETPDEVLQRLEIELARATETGDRPGEIARRLAERFPIDRREIYARIVAARRAR